METSDGQIKIMHPDEFTQPPIEIMGNRCDADSAQQAYNDRFAYAHSPLPIPGWESGAATSTPYPRPSVIQFPMQACRAASRSTA